MPTAILATKLFVPAPRANLVARARLAELLTAGLQRKLTLISAPAGFGKTTLVSAWVAECGRPLAWLSLDAGDRDPTRFLTYVIGALQTIDARIGAGARAALDTANPPPIETALAGVLNDVAALRDDVVLVFDDYHAVDARPIDDAVAFMLDHAPRQLHVVIVTREDPSLPLARLRAQNQLAELRAGDLRFTLDEATAFLSHAMGLQLSGADVAALDARTEGWIAGLQLAALAVQGALSTRGQDHASAFIESFSGNHRFVFDYLVEEVLRQQPEPVQRFLIRTSILDRLCAPLCEHVVGAEAPRGRDALDHLERANLLLVPLDDRREWYRYHHLFAEALRARLAREEVGLRRELHRRASDWFARTGLPHEAISHALAAQDFSRAADLLEMEARTMLTHHEEATWRGWVQTLPDPVVRVRPVLCVYFALALLPWAPDAADQRLRDAERWLDRAQQGDDRAEAQAGAMVVANAAEFRSTPGTLAIARAYHAGARGDAAGILAHAQRAVDALPAHDTFWRGAATALLGIANWANGDLEGAYASMSRGLTDIRAVGGLDSAVGARYLMADIRLAQGRLREAAHICTATLAEVDAHSGPTPQGTADLHVILSDVLLAQGEVALAAEHLHMAQALDELAHLVETRHRWHMAMALIERARGNSDLAITRLDMAEQRYVGGPIPDARPVAAVRARIWIDQGRLDAALGWARERNLALADEPSYAREFEHLTLARLVLASNRRLLRRDELRAVLSLLERLLGPAEADRRVGSMIEALVLQALSLDVLGDATAASAALRRALVLAEPEGYVRAFVDEGRALLRPLIDAAARGVAPDYARRLMAALGAAPAAGAEHGATSAQATLVEPLSERELEVLHLVAEGLSNHDIAQRLSVSLSTVKGHNLRLFGKLQVQRRTEAVARARELGLL